MFRTDRFVCAGRAHHIATSQRPPHGDPRTACHYLLHPPPPFTDYHLNTINITTTMAATTTTIIIIIIIIVIVIIIIIIITTTTTVIVIIFIIIMPSSS